MADKEKKNRWAQSLDDAGLLDEIDDVWELPGEVGTGATIRVEGRAATKKKSPTTKESEPVPFGVPQSHPVPAMTSEQPRTPRERESSSDDTANRRSKRKHTVPSGPFRRSTSAGPKNLDPLISGSVPQNIPVLEAELDRLTAPRTVRSTLSFAEEEKRKSEKRRASIHGKRISVSQESIEPEHAISLKSDPSAAIVDEPPSRDGQPTRGSISVPDSFETQNAHQKKKGQSADPLTLVEGVAAAKVRVAEMRELFVMGDYTGALAIAEEILEIDRENEPAKQCRGESRDTLMQMYESRIGSFGQVPVLAISDQEVIWRNLDPTTGFVLSRIDGSLSFEDILDISGLPRFETCRILNQLLADGIIEKQS